MARQSLIQPRSGSKAAIDSLTSGVDDQYNNELLIDNATKDLYVGLGAGTYNSKRTRPVTYNIGALALQASPAETDLIPIHRPAEGDTKHATLASIVALVEAETGGDTKDVKVESGGTAGFLSAKTSAGQGLAKSIVSDTVQYRFDDTYKVPLSAQADNALALQGYTVGVGSSNLWSGSQIAEYISTTTIEGITFFCNYNNNNWTQGGSWLLTALTADIQAKLNAISANYTLKIGDSVLFSHPISDNTGSLPASIYTITNFSGGYPVWSGSSPANTKRYTTDFTLSVDDVSGVMSNENYMWFIDSIQTFPSGTSTRGREIKMQSYSGSNSIDVAAGVISVKINSAQALTVSASGIGIKLVTGGGLVSGLSMDSAGLKVVPQAPLALDTTNDSVKLQFDANDFKLVSGVLTLNAISGGTI
jgi:hypothetical protein